MAQAAGYDVDELCRSLNKRSSIGDKDSEEMAPAKPRRTVSSRDAKFPRDMDEDRLDDFESRDSLDLEMEELREMEEMEELKPFGYDLFANVPNTFASTANIPVSSDYLLGPGDGLEIFFYGKLNQSFSVELNRDGSLFSARTNAS